MHPYTYLLIYSFLFIRFAGNSFSFMILWLRWLVFAIYGVQVRRYIVPYAHRVHCSLYGVYTLSRTRLFVVVGIFYFILLKLALLVCTLTPKRERESRYYATRVRTRRVLTNNIVHRVVNTTSELSVRFNFAEWKEENENCMCMKIENCRPTPSSQCQRTA